MDGSFCLGLTEDDLWDLENGIMENPTAAVTMCDTGGLRKLRWAIPGYGKSSGVRILNVDIIRGSKVFMIDLFTKKEKASLSQAESSALKQLIERLERSWKGNIKDLRLRLNLSQHSFAYAIGVSPKTVEAWETGVNRLSGSPSRMIELMEKDDEILKRLILS